MKNKNVLISLVLLLAVIFAIVLYVLLQKSNSYDDYIRGDCLDSFYDSSIIVDETKNSSVYTGDSVADAAITELVQKNKYNDVAVLDSWYDFGIDKQSYNILFDSSVLYNIVLDGNKVLMSELDYEYYLEYN